MDPDDSGTPQAIRSKFRAGCDYSVRVSSFRLGFVTNWTCSLIPVMISRLVVSLRKAADTSGIRVWNGDHFTSVESGEHEMMNFARPQPSNAVLTVVP